MTGCDMRPRVSRRAALAALAAGLAAGRARAQGQPSPDPWPSLRAQIFDDKPVGDGSALISIDAPYRAEDAAVVPIAISTTLPSGDARQVRALTLVIDQNPSPLAARFTLGDSGIDRIATRVRIDDYTNVHVVAQLSDGQLYAASRYVKAAGGCSAPALKQVAEDIPLGTMRFREFPPGNDVGGRREAQIMVRHPNYSGMQMDQITRLYIPAHFVTKLRMLQGSDLLFAVESGISISENPEFRFSFRPSGAAFRAEGEDNEGTKFSATWPAAAA